MCSIPPVPPPPPSRADVHLNTKQPNNINTNCTSSVDPNLCQWAFEHPELREACIKNSICVQNTPYKYKYKYFESIAQVGPTCGLVALSMVVDSVLSPTEIFNISKLEGYTCNGEMLSCKNMANLAKKVFSLAELDGVSYKLVNNSLFSGNTIERLLNGAALLVPYDADCNHSPCVKNGHTAHWALICGIIIVDDPDNMDEMIPKNIYVLGKHGKSKYLAVWDLVDLDRSNKNLFEFSPKKSSDGLKYIMPEGGIGGDNGLCGQYLILEGL